MFESHRASMNQNNKMSTSETRTPEDLLRPARRMGKQVKGKERGGRDGNGYVDWDRIDDENMNINK